MAEDIIEIKDLLLRTIIGIYDWERQNKQDVLINIRVYADLRAAGVSDNLADSVDYKSIAKQVIAHVEASQRQTVEALAADIAKIALAPPGATRARVRVEKPGAVRFARSVGVEIERRKEDVA